MTLAGEDLSALAFGSARRRLRVVVADDSDSTRAILSALIERMGHEVFRAADGEEAVASCRTHDPDLVFLDVMMPRLDGFQALAEIRRIPSQRWIPVIFVTALEGSESVSRALMGGGDDYITKPIQSDVLQAKLHAVGRALSLQDQVLAQRAELAAYRDHAEEEKRFARRLMDMLANTSRLADPALAMLSVPAEQLNGDVVAAARTPGGKLHVLLADGTGHGLAAALNVLPTIEPFYSMTAKGFSLPTILVELNRKLHASLPRECYVAAGMVAVDAAEGRVEVWNGGVPDVLAIERGGGAVRRVASANLPLGILKPSDFEARIEVLPLVRDMVLLLASDGLVESLGDRDLAQGLARMTELVAAGAPGETMAALVERFGAAERKQINDDLTLLAVDCRPAPRLPQVFARAVPAGRGAGPWQLCLNLGAHQLREIDVVPALLGFTRAMGLAEDSHGALFVVLSELFNNALDHGLLQLSSALKDRDGELEPYFRLRESRLAQLEHGGIDITVARGADEAGEHLDITVSDSGPGFDPARLATAAPDSRGGRGLALVRGLCESLEFRGTGNVAVARLRLE